MNGNGIKNGNESNGENGELYMTIEQVAEMLQVQKHYLYNLTHERKIPFIKLGKFLRFKKSDIEMWLEDQKVEPVQLKLEI